MSTGNTKQRQETKDASKTTASNVTGVRFSDETLQELDAEVDRRKKLAPWTEPTRVDVIREAVYRLLHPQEQPQATIENISRPSPKLTLTSAPKSASACLICSEALPKNHKTLCGKLTCKKELHRQREVERRRAAKV